MYDPYNPYGFPNTAGPFGPMAVGDPSLELLLQPITTAGEEILVGAPFVDPDIAALASLVQTSGWGGMAVGGPDILVGSSFGYDPTLDPNNIFTGAPAPAQTQAAQMRLLQQQLAQMKGMVARSQQQAAGYQKQAQVAQQQAIAAQQARQVGTPARVQSTGEQRYRKVPLPISTSGDILAGAQENVTTRPQMMAKPYRLIIENPQWWRILDVKVGNKSQFVAAGSIPGIAFSADSVDVTLVGDTAATSQDIIIVVQNKTGADHRFEGVLICHVVD